MKRIISLAVVVLMGAGLFSSCVQDDDTALAPFKELIFSESFPESEINYNQVFDFEGWTNFAEAGSKLWTERDFNGQGYIYFNPFGGGDASNIVWAITPGFQLNEGDNAVLNFESASNFVDNPANKLEVLISTDYDGDSTHVLTSTWTPLDAVVADETTNGYTIIPSGDIDLSDYSGNVHIAFRVTGNGTTLDGLFQVYNVKVFSNN